MRRIDRTGRRMLIAMAVIAVLVLLTGAILT